MSNYIHSLPRDKGGHPTQEFPAPKLAKARLNDENASASNAVSLTHDTTSLEVAAVGGPAVLRWIATSDTEASVVSAAGSENFDHVIPSGELRRFAVPIESNPQTGSVQGINRELGLYQRVALKGAAGNSSVLLAEF